MLLEAGYGLLGDQVSKQPEELSFRRQAGIGTEVGNFLLHRIVAVDPMTAWQDLHNNPDPKLVHLGDPNHLPYPVRAVAGGKAEHGGQRLRHEGTGQTYFVLGVERRKAEESL